MVKRISIHITLSFMQECVLSLKEKNNTTLVFLLSNCPLVLKIFYDCPFKYYFGQFRYMNYDYQAIGSSSVQLSTQANTLMIEFICTRTRTHILFCDKTWVEMFCFSYTQKRKRALFCSAIKYGCYHGPCVLQVHAITFYLPRNQTTSCQYKLSKRLLQHIRKVQLVLTCQNRNTSSIYDVYNV